MPTENELHPELISTAAINLSPGGVSGSRLQMLGAHLTQMLILKGATPRRCFTGVEREYGKYTYKVKMPVDGTVIAVVPKYQETIGHGAIANNPMSIVIYENVDTREICTLEIPQYHIAHQYFGFKYSHKRTLSLLSKGASIPKGTIFADSPAIDDNGDYRFGIEANVAYMTIPEVIEDGVQITESFSKKITTYGYETLDAGFGKKYFPLNLYGDDKRYKPFPDIGERVRSDGLIFALREYNELLDPIQMMPDALRKVNTFDKTIYTKANAKVVDVITRFDPKGSVPETPVGMDEQVRKYHTSLLNFYNTLLDIYERLARTAAQRRETLKISRPFHGLLKDALYFKIEQSKVKAQRIVQRQPLDEWRVDITVEYELEPTEGFKITGLSGDKGVVVKVVPDDWAPVDKHGTRADIIQDPLSIGNRMNPTKLLEHYLNATSDQVERELRAAVADGWTESAVQWCWERMLRYYQICSPTMYDKITSKAYRQTPRQHIEQLLAHKHGIGLHIPTNNKPENVAIVKALREEFPIDYGPVSYVGASGRRVTTIKPVMIASQYLILLEKTGSDWSACSSGSLQQHGILAKLTRHDKHARPGRLSPTRSLGEDETRLIAAVSTNNTSAQRLVAKYGKTANDGLAMAELMDLANSPAVHQEAVRRILTVPQPTNIQTLIDREKFPRGSSRSARYVKHHLEGGGVKFTYTDDLKDPATVYQFGQAVDDDGDMEVDEDEGGDE